MSELRRRSTDRVDPSVALHVEDRLAETRHDLRNDVALVGAKLETLQGKVEHGTSQSSAEHVQNAARLDAIAVRLEALETLPIRLSALERESEKRDAKDEAYRDIRFAVWKAAAALAAVIAVVQGLVALIS